MRLGNVILLKKYRSMGGNKKYHKSSQQTVLQVFVHCGTYYHTPGDVNLFHTAIKKYPLGRLKM